jgi:hypothetical protein
MTIRMYKPIKRLYFWLTAKVKRMKYYNENDKHDLARKLKTIKEYLLAYFDDNEKKQMDGYVNFIAEFENGFDFKIAYQKFSIAWFFTPQTIHFRTYYSKFDLNAPGNYKNEHIEELDAFTIYTEHLKLPYLTDNDHKSLVINQGDFPAYYYDWLEEYAVNVFKKDAL